MPKKRESKKDGGSGSENGGRPGKMAAREAQTPPSKKDEGSGG
jgi:hypothetical protein